MTRPPADDDADGELDVADVVEDAVFKQLESGLEETLVKPPEEGENPIPTTLISSLEPAGKSGVHRTHVVWMPVLRSFAVVLGSPFTEGSTSSRYGGVPPVQVKLTGTQRLTSAGTWKVNVSSADTTGARSATMTQSTRAAAERVERRLEWLYFRAAAPCNLRKSAQINCVGFPVQQKR